MTTAKSENSRKVSGWDVMCRSCRIVLNAPLRPRNGIQAMVRMMPEVQNGYGAEQEQHGADRGAAHVVDQEPGDVEAKEQCDRPDDDCEFQRTEIDAERRRRGQQLAVVVEQEGRVNADTIVVEEADHEEQNGRKREQRQQYQREWPNLQP